MHVKINNEPSELADTNLSIKELLSQRNINENGTAVAINGRLIPRTKWDIHYIAENDDIVIITASYGG